MNDVAELLRDAQVVQLEPDDLIVLRLAVDRLDETADLGRQIAEAFAPRRVVVLAAGVSIGHFDGGVHWLTGVSPA